MVKGFNINAFEHCNIEHFNSVVNMKNKDKLITINANSNLGFNYPYLLFIPNNVNVNSTIIVEGSNTSETSKEIIDIDNIKQEINESLDGVKRSFVNSENIIIKINDEITKYPVLYPLFPRLRYKEQSYFNHMLSSNSMFSYNNNILKKLGIFRTDVQLTEMINDATRRLKEYGLNVDEKVIITGFSASAKFANRFTLLHPEIVKYTIAGGLGGTITLPIREINGERLLWPIGIGNVDEITDEKLDLYKKVPQFYYHGIYDKVDSYKSNERGVCEYNGILQENEAIQLYKFMGKLMNEERWNKTKQIISSLNYNIVLKTYEGGHNRNLAEEDIKDIFLNM